MASPSRWKRHERQVARALGVEREPNDGRRHGDALPGPFSVEIKTMRRLPARVVAALDQARVACAGRIPVVVLSEGRPGVKARRLVLLSFEDWCDLHGPTAAEPAAPAEPSPEGRGD